MTRPYRLLSDLTVPPQSTATESNFVIILAALLCALICVVGLAAVARCAWLRRTSAADRRSSSGHPSPPRKGLKKEAVESLPKLRYNEAGNLKLTAECAICLAEYGEGEEIRVLPQCGHGFHVECVDTWLVSHSSCPSCRNRLMVARCRKCGEVTEEVKVKEEEDLNGTV